MSEDAAMTAQASNPGRSLNILFINGLLAGDFSGLDIGLTVLATHVNRYTRHRAAIADLAFHRKQWREHLHAEIAKKRPDVIAISCNTMYMKYVREILAEICKRHDLPVIAGGHHATVHPEDVFAIPQVQALVIGDGEDALAAWLDRIADGRSCEGIQGLWVKLPGGGELRNPGGGFLPSLDRLPYLDWDLWDDLDVYFRFLGMLYVQGSRGCPYRCTFCDARGYADALKDSGRYFRLRDPRAFADELAYYWERYHHRGMRLFQVFDPVFTMNTKWVEAFCERYRELGLHEKIRYSVFSRIDHLDEAKVRLLARSGCALLRVGIEAGDDKIRRDVYGKKITTETIRRIIGIAKENGLDFTAFYIIGGPAETRETFTSTVRLAWELDAARSAFFVYKPFTEAGRAQIEAAGGGVDEKRFAEADNISFGGTTSGQGWGPRTAEAFQMAGYGLTFGRRLARMVARRKLGYFTALASYMADAVKYGLDLKYAAMYFHIYEGDNVDR